MALDPNFSKLLAHPEAQFGVPPPEVTAPMLREATRAMAVTLPPPVLHEVKEVNVPGPAGSLKVRLYYPGAARDLPLILYYHGGGFVVCDLDSHDWLCRTLALASGCAVASVDYRLAPECRFPGPVEDCYAALQHFAQSGAQYGFDSSRIAVAGDSAGGSLAIAVALLARDRNGPAIKYQALFYPVTDAACRGGSMDEFATGYMLSADVMRWFWDCYISSPADGDHPLASPSRTAELAGLPPASVATAEYDVLRDEGERYADRLREAGVSTVSRRYLGMIHGFSSMPHITEHAARSITDLALDIRAALGESPAGVEAANVAAAQRLYGAALTGDWPTVEALVAKDCPIVESSGLPFAGTYVGPQGMQDLFVRVGGMLTILDVRIKSLIPSAETVVVSIDLVLDNRGTPETVQVVEVLRFKGGQVIELTPYYFDTARVSAIAAARV